MADVAATEQESKPAPSLKEVLLQSAFSKGRAISDVVQEIDLDIFSDECNRLRVQTSNDPLKREYGKLVYVTRDRRVLLQNRPTQGGEKSTSHIVKIYVTNDDTSLPWFLRQDRIVGAEIHSHPSEIPISSHDLSNVLLGDSDTGACVAEFVATPERNIVVFRGEDAPSFTRTQVSEKIEFWEKLMRERVEKFRTPSMSISEQIDLNNRVRGTLLRQIAEKYRLRIFVGNASSARVKLLT